MILKSEFASYWNGSVETDTAGATKYLVWREQTRLLHVESHTNSDPFGNQQVFWYNYIHMTTWNSTISLQYPVLLKRHLHLSANDPDEASAGHPSDSHVINLIAAKILINTNVCRGRPGSEMRWMQIVSAQKGHLRLSPVGCPPADQ
jgi:hypothetical protein